MALRRVSEYRECGKLADGPLADDRASAVEDLASRIARLEAQVAEQDAALRRVLTLLIDWVEGEESRHRPPALGSVAED